MSDRNQCRGAVARAIHTGVLVAEPPLCEVCSAPGARSTRAVLPLRSGAARLGRWSIVYHHHSYEPAFWLDVVAVCDRCHTRIHLGQLPEPRTGEVRVGARKKPTTAEVYRRPSPEI